MRAFLDRLTAFGQPLTIAAVLMRIGLAMVIGAVIGIEREIKNRPAGMRTHVLVCVGAALVSLIESQTVADVVALGNASIGVSMGRITTSVVSGVGFLGAGTIFMSDRKISGLTTAASLWCTACIGLAVGSGYILMAVAAGVIVLVILRLMAAHCACQHAQAAGGAVYPPHADAGVPQRILYEPGREDSGRGLSCGKQAGRQSVYQLVHAFHAR